MRLLTIYYYLSLFANEGLWMRNIACISSLKITNVTIRIDSVTIGRSLILWYFRYYWQTHNLHSNQIFPIKSRMLLIFSIFEVLLMLLIAIQSYHQILSLKLVFIYKFLQYYILICLNRTNGLFIDYFTLGFMSFSSCSTNTIK